MAVPFWLKLILPLLIFVAFLRALIGAGDLNLLETLDVFRDFEFDTTGIELIISVFSDEDENLSVDLKDYPMGDFPVTDGYLDGGGSSSNPDELFVVITPVPDTEAIVNPDYDGDQYIDFTDGPGVFGWVSDLWNSFVSFLDSIISALHSILTVARGCWMTFSEFFALLGRIFRMFFKVLGLG